MSLIKDIIKDWNKGKRKKESEKKKARLSWNIYDPGETIEQHQKNFWHVHYVFKYKLFLPLIRIMGRVMGKYLKKSVPDDPHNINIKLFKDSWDESVKKWAEEYMAKAYNNERGPEWIDKFLKGYSVQALSVIRDLSITALLYDSAYRELFNIFAHTFTKNMSTYHTDKGTRDKTGHLFFTYQDIYDVDYYMLFKKIEQQRYMTLHNVDQQKYSEERAKAEEELRNRVIQRTK